MIYKTSGVVIRTCDFGEADRIITLFTADFGKLKAVVKGVRKTKSRYGSAAELLTYDKVFLFGRPGHDLYRLTQCQILQPFKHLKSDLNKLSCGACLAELVDNLTPDHEKSDEIFQLLLTSLAMIEKNEDSKKILNLFMVRLFTLIGWKFRLDLCSSCQSESGLISDGKANLSGRWGGLLCGNCLERDKQALMVTAGTVQHLKHFQKIELSQFNRLKLSGPAIKELEHALKYFLSSHTERQIKSLDFIEAALNHQFAAAEGK